MDALFLQFEHEKEADLEICLKRFSNGNYATLYVKLTACLTAILRGLLLRSAAL